jgi:hypothetical protein
MQAYLKKHDPSFSNHRIKVDWQRNERFITIEFLVQKRLGPEWQSDHSFSTDWSKNWGLWNNDVVEAFLQLRGVESDITAPYLEVQVSPLNQPFALIITEPRKVYSPPKQLSFKSEVSLEKKTWSVKMELELPEELKGEHLFGGFYSCLATGPREYYALELNPEANPDFHRPELFLNLDH